MAAGRFDAPGTKFGPCVDDECNHRDCNQTREMIHQVCKYCEKEIGYETRFYFLPFEDDRSRGELVHALCHEDAIERERNAERSLAEQFDNVDLLDADFVKVVLAADEGQRGEGAG